MAASAKPLAGAKVLVVEDDALVAFDIISSLKDAGAEVVGPARTVNEALELAKAEDLCCGVLDVWLRDGPVFPAASLLRGKGAGIIFHTGRSEFEELKQDWPEAHVIIKPARPEQLMQALLTACCPAKPQRASSAWVIASHFHLLG
ncbi:MAG: hypothetical protein WBX25_11110 [Rhodomicrobium sp.]